MKVAVAMMSFTAIKTLRYQVTLGCVKLTDETNCDFYQETPQQNHEFLRKEQGPSCVLCTIY